MEILAPVSTHWFLFLLFLILILGMTGTDSAPMPVIRNWELVRNPSSVSTVQQLAWWS